MPWDAARIYLISSASGFYFLYVIFLLERLKNMLRDMPSVRLQIYFLAFLLRYFFDAGIILTLISPDVDYSCRI